MMELHGPSSALVGGQAEWTRMDASTYIHLKYLTCIHVTVMGM